MSLISLERAQKLDLLIHLISNLSQSLVLCGPKGIGKTTLLETLRETKQDSWPMCWVDGSAAASFESIQQQFTQQLSQQVEGHADKSLGMSMAHLQQNNQKFVLVIDNAGTLVPGLISSLIHFANVTPGLRLVFALTHDELHVKNSSDSAIEECHVIEIPPLTIKQCATFLQNLSSKQDANIAYQSISEKMVENLYQETHGIPGSIIQELPRLSDYREKQSGPWAWGGAMLTLILVALGVYIWKPPSSDNQIVVIKAPEIQEKVKTEPVNVEFLSKPEPTRVSHQETEIESEQAPVVDAMEVEQQVVQSYSLVPEGTDMAENKVDSSTEVDQQVTTFSTEHVEPPQEDSLDSSAIGNLAVVNVQKTEEQEPPETKIESIAISRDESLADQIQASRTELAQQSVVEAEVAVDPVVVPVVETQTALTQNAENNDITNDQWLKSQPADNLTLQLIVLSDAKAAEKFTGQYNALNIKLKVIKAMRNGSAKFIVLYGSYADKTAAQAGKTQLPKKLRNAWIRPFKSLQN